MWFKNIFHRNNKREDATEEPLFDGDFLRRLERLSLQAQRTLRGHPSKGAHISQYHLPSTIFSDHRPYTSGDDLRYVDWNAYARHDQIILKLGEAEQDIDVHLLIDASRSMAWGNPSKLRTAQQLAGALGYLSLAHGDRVCVAPFGATALRTFGPTQGKGRLIDMLQHIKDMPVQQQTKIHTVMQQHAQRYRRGGMLILLSDLLTDAGLDEGLRALPPPRWQVVILHVIDPREMQPDLQGAMELHDSETGERLALSLDETMLKAYRQKLHTWQEQIAATSARRGATYARILTDWPLEKNIVPYLRTRRLLV